MSVYVKGGNIVMRGGGVSSSSAVSEPVSVGPYTVASPYTTGLTGGDASVSAYAVWYPTDAPTPMPCVVWIGGNTNDINQAIAYGPTGYIEKDNFEWAYLLATYGFVSIHINPHALTDVPVDRATSLLTAATMLANENSRSGSPLNGLLQTTNMAAAGHSFGAAGAWIATTDAGNTRFVASWGINPVDSGSGTASSISVPMLFLSSGTLGTIISDSAAEYAAIGGVVPKILAVFNDDTNQLDMHNMARAPIATTWVSAGAVATDLHIWDHKACSLVVSFLQRYLKGDTRYSQFLVTDGTALSSFSSANIS